jgi:hypothetical protein
MHTARAIPIVRHGARRTGPARSPLRQSNRRLGPGAADQSSRSKCSRPCEQSVSARVRPLLASPRIPAVAVGCDNLVLMWLRGEGIEQAILQLLRRAGVDGAPLPSTGMLSSDRVLVFRGDGRQSLSIYGQDGSAIGSAVRVRDDYKQVGFRYHYELRDTELRWVLRDLTRRRLGVDSLTYAFSVLGADGADIGTITQSGRSNDSYEIALAGRVAGRVRGTSRLERIRDGRPFTRSMTLSEATRGTYDHLTSRAWQVEDEPGHSVAKITYIASQLTRVVTYVVELGARLDDQLRTIALTVGLIADNRMRR